MAAMELRPYQREAIEAIQEEWNRGVRTTLLVLPTGCHHPDQGILMMDGTVTKAKDIREGDYLMGPDGQPRTVLKLHHGIDEMYKVTPVKGKPFIVNSEHILPMVKTCESGDHRYPSQKGGRVDLVKTSEWEKKSKTWRHVHKLFRSPGIPKFWGHRDIYINPYFLGILLGNGEMKYGVVNVTTPDPEVVEHIYEQAEAWNMTVDTRPAGKAKTYFFKSGKTGMKGSSLHNALKKYGLIGKGSGEKFVPYEYKTAFEGARKELLAGLLDSDGCISCNGYDFVSKSKRLAEDVVFISRSLGLAAYLTKTQKSIKKIGFTGTYWRVSISGNTSIIPCRVARKQCHKRKQSKDVLRTGIRSIEPIGRGEYFGFTVDGDNLYLMDDFTVTHNCGKTIVFAKITEDCVRQGKRVLILAHRGELLDQAADKLEKSTGLKCSVEKAEQTCLDSWYRVTVGSVQSLQRETRLEKFNDHYFDVIIVDEAHHAVSDSYQRVLHHFDEAKVLGVTATPDRSDLRNLGSYFESLAYEYTLPRAIKEGYLCPIKALTIPLKLDISDVGISSGDFKAGEIGSALDPYLEQIADEMTGYCMDRKTVVFLPLIATSQKFRDILISKGFRAGEVNGESKDRAQVLEDFEAGKYDVLCNSMLLTEGWDCPSVDCIVVLRPTKVRSLYTQMVGRGTRLSPGKESLLLLDFLWMTEKHELCRPASLICETEEVAKAMTRKLEENAGEEFDLEEAEKMASESVVEQREAVLAAKLAEMRRRKRKLVDPLQYEMSIQDEDLVNYVPAFGWEMGPVTDKQKATLEKLGIMPDEIESAGKAAKILDRLDKRRNEGLTTPKQIRFLERNGFRHVGTWQFEDAKHLIDRIASNGWRVPRGINPETYKPAPKQMEFSDFIG